MKHPYAEILNAIAEGKQIQFNYNGGWVDQAWSTTLVEIVDEVFEPSEYRVKPNTINIGGFEVPKPVTDELEKGQRFWVVELTDSDLVSGTAWDDHAFDRRMLKLGLIHLTKEAAQTHAQALIDITKDAQNA